MDNIKIFENPEFGKVRVVDIEGTPWFAGQDVAEVLGYNNTRDALLRHVYEEDKAEVGIHDDYRRLGLSDSPTR